MQHTTGCRVVLATVATMYNVMCSTDVSVLQALHESTLALDADMSQCENGRLAMVLDKSMFI